MKKILSLLALIVFGCVGAWAQQIEAGKVYTIKAHFSNRNDLYFTVRGGQLCFDSMRESSEDIYKWKAESTGNSTYPWAFKNVGTDKYLNGRGGNVVDAYTTGSNEVGCFKITACTGNYAGYYNLNAVATNRNLGTWSSSDTSSKGFGGSSCYSTGGQSDAAWTTYYEIEEATDATEWYTLQATATAVKYLYATGDVESGKVYVKQANGDLNVGDIDKYLWKIEGDDAHGYKVINKKTGRFIGCENITADGTTASNTKAILTDNETTDGVYTRFKLGGYQAALQVLNDDAEPTGVFINPASNGNTETRFFVANNNGNTQRVKALAEYVPNLQTAISAAYAKNGCVGYPADMSSIASYSAENGVTKSNLLDACSAYQAILSNTNINLPEAGKAYKMYFQCANSATKYYIQPSGNPSTNAETAAVAVLGDKGGANNAQRFYFVNSTNGQYFSYQGYTTAGYNATIHNFKIVPVNSYNNLPSANNLTLSKDRSFGLVFLYATKRPGGSNNGGVVVSESNGAWSATSDPFFNGSYTSGIVFEEVENPNKLKLSNPNPQGTSGLDNKSVGTFSAAYAVQLPAGVEAYKATIDGSTVTFETIGSVVPANTGVLVYASDGTTYDNVNAVPAAAVASTVDGNALHPANGEIAAGTYVLGKGSHGVGFYARQTPTTVANKAYLEVPAGSNLSAFRFDFEETVTGIEAVESNTNATVFDLQGRRVQNAKSGLYIVNGKKVIR